MSVPDSHTPRGGVDSRTGIKSVNWAQAASGRCSMSDTDSAGIVAVDL